MDASILDAVSLVLAVVFVILVLATYGSKDQGVMMVKIMLIIALLVVNILEEDFLMAALWGVLIFINLFSLGNMRN